MATRLASNWKGYLEVDKFALIQIIPGNINNMLLQVSRNLLASVPDGSWVRTTENHFVSLTLDRGWREDVQIQRKCRMPI